MKMNAGTIRGWVPAAVTAVGLWAGPARGQEAAGFALDRFEPSERGSEWFVTDSLDFRGDGRPAMGLVLDWARRPLVFRDDDGTSTPLVNSQLFAHFGTSVVFGERLRLGASLPVAMQQSGQAAVIDGADFVAPRGSAVGDLRLAADVRLLGNYRDVFSLAAGVRAWLPTGDREAYTGDGTMRFGGQVLAAGEKNGWVYAARMGVNYRGLKEQFANSPLGTDVSFAVSAGVRVLSDALVVGPELFGSTVVVDGGFFAREATPVDAILGGHYTVGSWRVGAGAGPGLTRGMGSPAFRGLLSVEYIPAIEAAPAPRVSPLREAPCPEPSDRDGDGIVDEMDACPDEAGLAHTDPTRHGCPPLLDADSDGIPDVEDACPNEAGVASTDPARHGCPAIKDRDGDGIVDEEDACPSEAGSASDDPARHGCPQAKVSGDRLELLQRVEFSSNSANLLAESHELLRDVARAIKTLPASTKIRVEGHTDNRGWPELNQKLSQQRAESVVEWLVSDGGIARDRLTSAGFGDRKPIASNNTEEGRQTNRRVEFHIISDKTTNHSTEGQ